MSAAVHEVLLLGDQKSTQLLLRRLLGEQETYVLRFRQLETLDAALVEAREGVATPALVVLTLPWDEALGLEPVVELWDRGWRGRFLWVVDRQPGPSGSIGFEPLEFLPRELLAPQTLSDSLARLLGGGQVRTRPCQEQFREFFEASPDPSLVIDGESLLIVAANRRAEDCFGYPRGLLAGRSVQRLLPPGEHPLRGPLGERVGVYDSVFEALPFARRDGSAVRMDLTARMIPWHGGISILVQLREVGERENERAGVTRIERTLNTLDACNQALLRAQKETPLMRDICRILVEVGGYGLAWTSLTRWREEDGKRLLKPAAWWDSRRPGMFEAGESVWEHMTLEREAQREALSTGQPCSICIPDNETGRPYLRRGLRRFIALPFLAKGRDRPMGVINLYSIEDREPGPEELRLLTNLGENLSYGLSNLRLSRELQAMVTALRYSDEQRRLFGDKLKNLVRLVQRLSGVESMEVIYQRTIREGRGVLGCDRLALWLYDPETRGVRGTFSVDREGNLRDERGLYREIDPESPEARLFQENAAEVQIEMIEDHYDGENNHPVQVNFTALSGMRDALGYLVARNETNRRPIGRSMEQERELLKLLGASIGRLVENKRIEQERARLAVVVDQAAESIVLTDLEGRIQYVNPAFERVTGYRRDEVLGQNPSLLKSGRHDDSLYRKMWETILSGQVWHGRLVNKNKHDDLFYEDITISPLREADGAISHFVAVKRDISLEVTLEKQLQQAQKMEAIGTLAGGIAHDFNNILSPIMGYGEMALTRLVEGDPVASYVGHIVEASRRARDLVDQILTFSRQADQRLRPIRIYTVVHEALKLIRASVPTTIEIVQNIDSQAGEVLADPTQIHQVVMNLCTNAMHALEGRGGCITVTLERRRLDAETATGLGLVAGEYVELDVADTGTGIPPELRERIFDPFFTTKEVGRGTGMGLAVTHGIITAAGGALEVESEVGQGSCFRIYLPASAVGEEKDSRPERSVSGGEECIVMVDDEIEVIRMFKIFLDDLGYEVRVFSDPVAALEDLRSHPRPADLLITDQTMPGLTGLELTLKARAARPGLPVILSSGFSEQVTEDSLRESGIDGYLQKPVPPHDLAREIRRLLDTRGALQTAAGKTDNGRV